MVEETRAKLVQAARAAFAAKGYAAASMDDLTAQAGLTRGALYHNFGDKKGLLQAVISQIDAEMLGRLRGVRERAETPWLGLLDESVAYIEMALEPEIQRIMLLDGPAVLGDPSRWPNQGACLLTTTSAISELIQDGTVAPVDAESAARLLNGAALNASLWIAAAEDPAAVLPKAVAAFRLLASGLLRIAETHPTTGEHPSRTEGPPPPPPAPPCPRTAALPAAAHERAPPGPKPDRS